MAHNNKYTMAVDLSTTAAKTCLLDPEGTIIAESRIQHKTYFPQPDWIEQDPEEIICNIKGSIAETVRLFQEKYKGDPQSISSIGVTNQRETLVVWNKVTHKLLYKAIVWYDGRTRDIVERHVKLHGSRDAFKKVNGLIMDTYFTLFKLLWVLENVEEADKAYKNDELMVGTVDSWIIYNLSMERNHYTDVTNASRTFLMNLRTLDWDADLLKMFDIKKSVLPQIKNCVHNYGKLNISGLEHVEIRCVMGDQQSAAYTMGLCNSDSQILKITYGTGCFMILNTNSEIIDIEGLITTVLYKDKKKTVFGIEGSVEAGGTTQLFLRQNFGADQETILKDIENQERFDCPEIFVSTFGKVLAPYWQSTTGSIIANIMHTSTLTDLYRASLEGIAFRIKQCFDKLPVKIDNIYIDGGLSNCNYLMKFQTILLQSELRVMGHKDCTLYGVALCAGGFPDLVHGEKDYVVVQNIDNNAIKDRVFDKYARFCKKLKDTLI